MSPKPERKTAIKREKFHGILSLASSAEASDARERLRHALAAFASKNDAL